ncbi:MAG: S8 family serine peptidase [Verrucomicrobiota bacterium]|nr:S8 family serine peptidase [Limisphaera sp.]MDW8380507.1 S8 family serine peptidase [Verrucomicrobiota bacterium]
MHEQFGGRVLHTSQRFGGWQVVELPRTVAPAAVMQKYQQSGLIAQVELDAPIQAAMTLPDDPFFQSGAQWHLNNYGQDGGIPDADVDAPEAWDVVREAPDLIVAVLDSGVRWTHEDLRANVWRNPRDGSPGLNPIAGTHDPWDDNGHGTHVAGLIGAVANNRKGVSGVVWRVRLMAIKVLDGSGNGLFSDALIGLDFALTNGARVLNISWTSTTNSLAFSNMLWQAGQVGVVVVCAAGNTGANLDLFPVWPAALRLPCQLTVAASTRTDDRYLTSAFGPQTVDLYAPGVSLYSTASAHDSAYASLSGTSMAAAVVSGAVALTIQRFPEANPQEIVRRLRDAVDVRPAFQGRCRSGGRLNLRRIVDLPRLEIVAGNPPLLQCMGQPGHTYVLWVSSDLYHWSSWTQVVLSSNNLTWMDPDFATFPSRFYRATPAP